jgi:hypothetical protein
MSVRVDGRRSLRRRSHGGDASIRLSLSSSDTEFGGSEVAVALDDFRVVRGRIVCP